MAGTAVACYGTSLYLLNKTWYDQYDRGSFHFFNDWNEWEQMDKVGHSFSAYFESVWAYKMGRWTGLSEKHSILTGIIYGNIIQTGMEILDGYSTKWGFSVYDIGFNIMGTGLFWGQQATWHEQRIRMKLSAYPVMHPEITLTSLDGTGSIELEDRVKFLSGNSVLTRVLKDYNAQTLWLSVNIHDFLSEESKFPPWLNIALGYGAENMYGGTENSWEFEGKEYSLNTKDYPRYRQFYISPDIDFTKIPTRSGFLKTAFFLLNIFKFPAPALEVNTLGKVQIHGVFY